MDKYTKKYIVLIKEAETDEQLSDIIDKIYTDGFDDGENVNKNQVQQSKNNSIIKQFKNK